MEKINELTAFQRNMNCLTLYLYLMNTRCNHLQDYDDEGDFETHNSFFNLCRSKLKDKIECDQNLLVNKQIFKDYFLSKENADKKGKANKLKKEEEEDLYETFFEYSNNLPKSEFRNKSYNYVAWSLVAMLLSAFIWLWLFLSIKDASFFKDHFDLFLGALCLTVVPFYFLVRGIILRIELNNNKITKIKFKYMYSDDYCYRRIKEAEVFFRAGYNVQNEIRELNEVERKFPENDNLFYKTIKAANVTGDNEIALLRYNENVYCRAVFSDLFKILKKDGLGEEERGRIQQIPFVFRACQLKTKLKDGNTGFVQCVNHILLEKNSEYEYVDVGFSQAMPRLKNPEEQIWSKYRKILKKYENILK